jgi:hypothetical protein
VMGSAENSGLVPSSGEAGLGLVVVRLPLFWPFFPSRSTDAGPFLCFAVCCSPGTGGAYGSRLGRYKEGVGRILWDIVEEDTIGL